MDIARLSKQFAEHEEKDVKRFAALATLVEEQSRSTRELKEAIEPLLATIQWLNATSRFAGWLRPIVLTLLPLAGLWIAIKGLFK
jgi:hypothetical protein